MRTIGTGDASGPGLVAQGGYALNWHQCSAWFEFELPLSATVCGGVLAWPPHPALPLRGEGLGRRRAWLPTVRLAFF